jgi:predicted AAA+ superfamily ATPase
VNNTVEIRLPGLHPTAPSSADIRGALAAAQSLLLYTNVLLDRPALAYVGLLRTLSDRDAELARARAVDLFASLAEAFQEPIAGPGDAWQRHLARKVLAHENPFSRQTQRRELGEVPEGVRRAAEHDLAALAALFDLAGERLALAVSELTGACAWSDLDDLGMPTADDPLVARLVLAEPGDAPALVVELARRYRRRGVGRFAEHRAFRWVRRPSGGALVPVRRPDPITFGDLIGYAVQRATIRRNTEHFLAGRPANNLLLYGERGTGKSSMVKALLNAHADQGLRLVEVAKSALGDFSEIVALLADQSQRFIVFVDDLSFDEGETGYAELKAVLEGGVEVRPDNVLIYATSNRRHLVVERFGDRLAPGDEIHVQDTLQEKLSLADRFGVTVIFLAPDQDQYLEIVEGLARRRALPIDDVALRRRALQWASWNNGRSGRTARQFVDDLTAELL